VSLNRPRLPISGSVARTEADLKAGTAIRAKENADFEPSEKELLDVIDTLERAILIIEKEMKGGASMMQLQRVGGVIDALSVMRRSMLLTPRNSRRWYRIFRIPMMQTTSSPQAPQQRRCTKVIAGPSWRFWRT